MYPHKRISALYALLLLFILIFSGCQNSNSANSATPTENRTPETFAGTPTPPGVDTFAYHPSFISFESLETMGNAMKGYELNDAVKNDSRFTAKEKAVIENIQKNKGHNDLYYDMPALQNKTFESRQEVRLIYSSDIEKGKGVENWLGFGVGFTVTDGNNDYDLDLYGWQGYDKDSEYTTSIGGTVVSDTEEAAVILLGTNGTAKVYDVYWNNRDYHARLASNAPTEQVLSLVNAVKLETYEYDEIV